MIYFFTFQTLTYLFKFKNKQTSKMGIYCLTMLLNNYNKSAFTVVLGADHFVDFELWGGFPPKKLKVKFL